MRRLGREDVLHARAGADAPQQHGRVGDARLGDQLRDVVVQRQDLVRTLVAGVAVEDRAQALPEIRRAVRDRA